MRSAKCQLCTRSLSQRVFTIALHVTLRATVVSTGAVSEAPRQPMNQGHSMLQLFFFFKEKLHFDPHFGPSGVAAVAIGRP